MQAAVHRARAKMQQRLTQKCNILCLESYLNRSTLDVLFKTCQEAVGCGRLSAAVVGRSWAGRLNRLSGSKIDQRC